MSASFSPGPRRRRIRSCVSRAVGQTGVGDRWPPVESRSRADPRRPVLAPRGGLATRCAGQTAGRVLRDSRLLRNRPRAHRQQRSVCHVRHWARRSNARSVPGGRPAFTLPLDGFVQDKERNRAVDQIPVGAFFVIVSSLRRTVSRQPAPSTTPAGACPDRPRTPARCPAWTCPSRSASPAAPA